jgi:hypothetical protein
LIFLRFLGEFRSCERPHSGTTVIRLHLWSNFRRGKPVNDDPTFNECVILDKNAFDPDAVFLDDIVDDEVLPRLSLAVDGLTGAIERNSPKMELHPDDTADDVQLADTTMPVAALSPELLEVYGWESSIWRKIRGYLGF